MQIEAWVDQDRHIVEWYNNAQNRKCKGQDGRYTREHRALVMGQIT
jgi:hypothetical protein